MEHLEQFNGPQGVASLLRLTSMVVLNILIDASMLLYCAGNVTLDEKPNVLILFAFGGFPHIYKALLSGGGAGK